MAGVLLWFGGAYVLTKLLKLKKAGDELSTSISAIGISRIENLSLKMWCEVFYDNFTPTQLTIQQPTLKVFLNDTSTEIGHALPSSETVIVPANGRNEKAQRIVFVIPLSNIPFAVSALLAGEKANRKIIVKTSVRVNGILSETQKEYTI